MTNRANVKNLSVKSPEVINSHSKTKSQGWEFKKLCELVSNPIVYGIVQAGPHMEGGIPYIKSSDVGGEINVAHLSKTSLTIASKYKRSEVRPGDIIISLRGNIGNLSIIPNLLSVANLTQGTARISVKKGVSTLYIFYALQSPQVVRKINHESKGSTFKEISLKDLRNIQLPIPRLEEQLSISKILATWDDAITKSQELIEQLRRRNRGLMRELLTPKKTWQEYHLGDLLKEAKRPVSWDDNERYDLISVRRRSGGAFFRESLYGRQILTKTLFNTQAKDFLISKMQIVHGASALVPEELAGMKISGSYIVVRSKNDKILDINFFSWLSKTKWFYRLTYISSYGVHIEKMTFDFADFKRRKIRVPASIAEQRKISGILQQADKEINILEERLRILQDQKKGLMQTLLSGKIRVQ